MLAIAIGVLLLGGCAQREATEDRSETPAVTAAPDLSSSPGTEPSPTPGPSPVLPPTSATAPTPTSTLTPTFTITFTPQPLLTPTPAPTATPTTPRESSPGDVLYLLISELAALRKVNPDQFSVLGNTMVDEFIAAHGSENVAADAYFLKTCFGDGDGHALRQFPLSLRSHHVSWNLLGHPDFRSVMSAACPSFFDLINGPFERYILWRSWEPNKTSFAATDIAEEISRTPYGDLVDYSLALILSDDEAEKIPLLEGIVENGAARRIARTAFKQLYKAYRQQPERARGLGERWLGALVDAQAPDRELLEVLHRLEDVSPNPIYDAVLQSRILQVTDQDYLDELETDRDFLGAEGFRFAPSRRTVPEGVVSAGVDQNFISRRGFDFVVDALEEWQEALKNRVTFEVSYLSLPPRQEGSSLCVADLDVGAITWTVYSYNLDSYGEFSRDVLIPRTGAALTLESLPAGLAVMPLLGDCRSIGIREDVMSSDPTRLQYVLLHEIGHLLGLPHSPQPDDVMSQSHSTNNILSDRDKRTIGRLYSNGS